ncbi:hypothetical protein V6N13_110496 [Hibiscus sabdariffa]|uniref:Uncharacterized protein n=1 Tax=Hibiscus sabdariffa TaxID=183260 RepID=A0ABR2THW5_9ROSI
MDHCWVLKQGHGSIADVGTGLQSWSIKWADEGLFRLTGSVKTKLISRFKDPQVELKGEGVIWSFILETLNQNKRVKTLVSLSLASLPSLLARRRFDDCSG